MMIFHAGRVSGSTVRPAPVEVSDGSAGPRPQVSDQIVDRYPVQLRGWQQQLQARSSLPISTRVDMTGSARIILARDVAADSLASIDSLDQTDFIFPARSDPLA